MCACADLRRFAERHELLEHYTFDTNVHSVRHNTRRRTATLHMSTKCKDGQNRARDAGPFDLVIYASLASQPSTPHLDGEFHGYQCVLHPSHTAP